MTITPDTASPYAAASAELEPNVTTSRMQPAQSDQLTKGT
jgi:hypothetical protein